MTTIAFKDGILAADRCTTMTGGAVDCIRFPNSARKIFDIEDVKGVTHFVTGAGNPDHIMSLADWVQAGAVGKHPAFEETTGFVFTPGRGVRIFSDSSRGDWIEVEMFALGSGDAYAIGAMAAGASAVDAIKIAAQFDSDTSEFVDVVGDTSLLTN